MWQKWASLNPSQGWGGFTVQVHSQALRFSGQKERSVWEQMCGQQ